MYLFLNHLTHMGYLCIYVLVLCLCVCPCICECVCNRFCSGITGMEVECMYPSDPAQSSSYVTRRSTRHVIFTAETHNFPTGGSEIIAYCIFVFSVSFCELLKYVNGAITTDCIMPARDHFNSLYFNSCVVDCCQRCIVLASNIVS